MSKHYFNITILLFDFSNGVYPTRMLPEPTTETPASPPVPEVVTVAPSVQESNKENSQPTPTSSPPVMCTKHQEEPTTTPIMPWRAQLRKTNSTLNLLE